MTHTDVDQHAWSATTETTNLLTRTTTRKIVAIFLVNRRHLSGSGPGRLSQRYHIHVGSPMVVSCARPPLLLPLLLLECALEPPTTRAKIKFERQRGTFRKGNRQLDGGTAPSTTLSGGTYFGFRKCSCSVASLSSNAAQIASVKSPRAPTPSADDSHGVVPAAGTSASSVVSSSQVNFFLFFLSFSTAKTRAFSDVSLGHGLSS